MKVVCAETVLQGSLAFGSISEVTVLPDRAICRDDLMDADALIVRSKTLVTPSLLKGTPVKFVGTATAGSDHFDDAYLDQHQIYHCSAPGCNSNSVAEYVIASLLHLHSRHDVTLAGKTIGIIGCGNVGSNLSKKALALGMNVLRNDPPLAATGVDPDFVELDELLARSDIVSLHVPLVYQKPWPTYKMADYLFFEKMKPGTIFINAARGSVVDYDALLLAKKSEVISYAVIDVWDSEPILRPDVVDSVDLATAHIAGHSYDGKLNGTIAVYNDFCNFFEIQKSWDIESSRSRPETSMIYLHENQSADEDVLHDVVSKVYNIKEDDGLLRRSIVEHTAERATNYDFLRKHYRTRHEFMHTTIHTRCASNAVKNSLKGIGFFVQ